MMPPFRFEEGLWPESAFDKILEAIGQVPDHERERIGVMLEGAAVLYRQYRGTDRASADRHRQERFDEIAEAAEKLLELLGFEDPTRLAAGWPTTTHVNDENGVAVTAPNPVPAPLPLLLPILQKVAKERRGEAATMDAMTRFRALTISLSDLAKAAHRVGGAPKRHGRGGARREGHKAPADLVFAILDIYAGTRSRYPDSGPPVKYGDPLLRFVRACITAVDPDLHLTDSAIRGHFYSWKPD